MRFVLVFHLEVWVLRNLWDKLLVDLVRYCLDRDVRPKILRIVSTELDARARTFVANYKFGSITKQAVLRFTGKSTYKFGDITKKILKEAQARHRSSPKFNKLMERELEAVETVKQAVLGYTSKSKYTFGDITKRTWEITRNALPGTNREQRKEKTKPLLSKPTKRTQGYRMAL